MRTLLRAIFISIIFIFFFAGHVNGQEKQNGRPDSSLLNEYLRKTLYFEQISEYDSARFYLDQTVSLFLFHKIYDSVLLADLYYQGSKLNSLLGNTGGAVQYLQKSMAFRKLDNFTDSTEMVRLYNESAYLFFNSEDYENALLYYEKVRNFYNSDAEKNAYNLSKAFSNIGAVYYCIGNYELALKNNFNALNIVVRLFGENHPFAGVNLANIALVYSKVNEYELAEIFYKRAQDILLKSLGYAHPEIAKLNRNFGMNYFYKKEYEAAIELIKNALDITIGLFGEQNIQVADVYNELAFVYAGNEEFEKAIDYYQLALRVYLENYGKSYQRIAENYNNIAEMFYKQGKLKKSLDYYKRSLDIYNKFLREPHLEYALNYTNIGSIYSKRGEYERALFYFQKALIANSYSFNDTALKSNPLPVHSISRPDLLVTLREKANCLYLRYLQKGGKNDLDASYNTYQLTIQLLGSLRNEQRDQNQKMLLNAENKDIFSNMVDINWRFFALDSTAWMKEMFSNIEKSKSDVLYASINDLNAKKLSGIPDSLLSIEKDIRNQLAFQSLQIQRETEDKSGYDTLRVLMLEEKYRKTDHEYQKFIEGLEKSFPRYYELKYQTKVAGIPDIQNTLGPQTALLEYFLSDSFLYLTTITKNSCQVYRTGLDTSFYRLVLNFYRSIKKADTREFLLYSHKLYNYLLKPAATLIDDKTDLVIIPDEYLLYIPFETLISSKPDTTEEVPDFTKPDYLVKKFNISYHYSATIWKNSHEPTETVKCPERGFAGYAPVFRKNPADTGKEFLQVRELPYSESEVNGILFQFESKKIPSDAFIEKNATENIFKATIPHYKYIHIATHSIINDHFPALSKIVFYPQYDSAVLEDGLLFSEETYNLDLHADLVVLSSCETGIGKLIKGEGLLALSRGFLYSGANNIVFSLWKVFDKNTKDLMEEFYRNLLENKSYPESLRQAKLKLINNKATAFPVNWGAFILVGQ